MQFLLKISFSDVNVINSAILQLFFFVNFNQGPLLKNPSFMQILLAVYLEAAVTVISVMHTETEETLH